MDSQTAEAPGKDGFTVDHFKDCIRLVPGNGGTDRADHAALEDITQPRPHQVWHTAWAEIHSMFDAAIENYKTDPSEYNRGRMNALSDASGRLHGRYVKS